MSLAKAVPLTCTGHSRPVTYLHFSNKLQQDTRLYLLISACKDGNPMLRDGVSGDWIGTYLGHKGAIWCSKLTEDGSFALTASADFSANVWDSNTGKIIANLPHEHIVRTCDFAPGSCKDSCVGDDDAINVHDDLMVATAGSEKKIRIWNVRKRLVSLEWQVDTPIRTIMWVSRSLIITINQVGLVQWWDVSGTIAHEINRVDVGGDVGQVEYVNDWVVFATGTRLTVIHGVTGKLVKQLELDYHPSAVSLSADLTKFITGSTDDTYVRCHDFESGKLLETSKGHHGPVHAVRYSPDGCLVATGSEDGTVRLWKTTSGPYGLWNSS